MRWGNVTATFDATLHRNKLLTIALMVLALSNLMLIGFLATKDRTVVLVPPNLEQRGEISKQGVSEQIQVSWGLYLATLFGNVTPRTVGFLADNIGLHLSPRMYRPVIASLREQAQEIETEQLTVSFIPTLARFEPKTRRVVVTGQLETRGVRGAREQTKRTYEFAFLTQNHRVLVDDIRVYDSAYDEKQSQQPSQED